MQIRTDATADVAAEAVELEELLTHGQVRSVYQPIVDMASGDVVAYEALARGPAGGLLEFPDTLFAAAAHADRTRELDWECQRAALCGALAAGLGRRIHLFVNVEPGSIPAQRPAWIVEAFDRAEPLLSVVFEVSERAVLAHPKELLDLVGRARIHGRGIALDDVGVNRESLSLMPLVDPDVIKLDIAVIQQSPTAETGRLLNAVSAQVERSGAVVLAEGVETEAHATFARSLGASLGQGWLYGHPEPVPNARPPGTGTLLAARTPEHLVPETPFDLVEHSGRTMVATKDLLLAISLDLEHHAVRSIGDEPVVLGAFQTASRFTAATRRRYERLAEACVFVGAVAVGLDDAPGCGVRGGTLATDDRLIDEWVVTVMTPHLAAALIARDLGGTGPEMDRRFEYAISHDRELVSLAARSLMHRIVATT